MNSSLEYKGYFGIVSLNGDEEKFYGKVHGINDLITFEGVSVKELKKAFKDAINDYLKTCAKLDKKPNKTFKGTFNIRLSPDLHQRAALTAYRRQLTLNDFVKKAISYALEHEKEVIR
jgi:predicted HicB family RNase H-like nuclease